LVTLIIDFILWFPSWHAVGANFLSLTQTLYSRPYMAKFWHKTSNNQSYTLEHWYGESRLWQKAVWLESKSLYVTKFSIELTAASITRLQFSEWYRTSKQKFKLFIFLFTNNCYKVALCTPLYAWHGHVAPRHINWSSDAMVIEASNTCRIWLPDLSPNLVLFGWPK
jgi:hypothetical protein